jgi:hypothetical protein
VTKLRLSVVTVATVWAAVIVGISSVLHASPLYNQVLILVVGGAAATLIVLAGMYRRLAKS